MQLQAAHHSYRKIERVKRFYHVDTESLMRRQQALLDNLKSENDSLQEMVDTYVIKDYRKQMALCLEEANRFTGLIESETKKLHNLEGMVQALDAKELDCKTRMGGYTAGWTKHRTTQIHIQQDENRLQKTTVDNNIVKGHIKMLKGRMSQLREEQKFYDNIYQKLNKELHEVEQDIQQCIANMEGMYADRNEYQEEISDLLEMADSKHNYSQWLDMEGWATQEPFALAELSSSAIAAFGTRHNEDDIKKDAMDDATKEKTLNKKRKTEQLMRRFTTTHYTMRKKTGGYYRRWVEIKAFANTQDTLKVNNAAEALPSILGLQKQNAQLFKEMNDLLKEMEGLDSVKQDHIFEKSAGDGDVKSNVAARRYEVDEAVDFLLDSIRHLEIDDEAFIPIVIDMKKQILLVFKEAGNWHSFSYEHLVSKL
ncbi:hypothetical protein GOP47_0001740 [Adiantum capillus-veneris]|uniref:ODAD1 central coiled coil region domain-containing protein n=1 Tax=Adiantum capillus-veneris TaxID=13818 RepID=A0A9D4ZQE7_ADICA|nr:hypothetical protein GOP47_0001740 [Adiantum capillus-veneris]